MPKNATGCAVDANAADDDWWCPLLSKSDMLLLAPLVLVDADADGCKSFLIGASVCVDGLMAPCVNIVAGDWSIMAPPLPTTNCEPGGMLCKLIC